jgi:5'-3' exonuclease
MMGNIESAKSFDTSILVNKILCAIDKDLLFSISGKHWNYTYRLSNPDNLESLVKGYWVETNNILGQCEVFKAKQTLMGDSGDSVRGLEKVGEITAMKILTAAQDNMDVLFHIVAAEYISRLGVSQGIFEFQKNYRLLHLLDCDEDYIREVGQIPKFPIISEVKREFSIEKQIEDLI